MYLNKEDALLSIGDIGTWKNGIILCIMHEKAKMNTYEEFLVEKGWKKCNWCQKRKNKEKEFFKLTIGNVLHYLILLLPIKTRFLYLFLELWKLQMWPNYIKRNLVNPKCSSITIQLFSWTTCVVHIFKLKLQDYTCAPQEPTSSHIHIHTSRKSLQGDF